jgi:hypothetical protein
MQVTQEFKDFYNTSFGHLKSDVIKLDIKRVEDIIYSFNGDVNLLDEYLQKASATSDTEVLCVLYIVLSGNSGFEELGREVKNVLLKYEEHLRAIKEFNKPSRKHD